MSSFRSVRRAAPAALPVLAVALAACGGGGGADTSSSAAEMAVACDAARPGPVAVAVEAYIGSVDPRPLRFLTAAASDSALPDDALKVVQDKGPTFYWLDGEKQQQQILDKLASDGDWATLLVVYRGGTREADDRHVVEFGGRYIGGKLMGTEAPSQRYELVCEVGEEGTAWKVVSPAPEADAPAEAAEPSA